MLEATACDKSFLQLQNYLSTARFGLPAGLRGIILPEDSFYPKLLGASLFNGQIFPVQTLHAHRGC